MLRYRTWLQHIANPLHIYCRLMDWGLGRRISRRLGVFYEKSLFLFVSKDINTLWNSVRRRSS